MRPNKSIRFDVFRLKVLPHLTECPVCLSRVTAIVRGIPAAEAEKLARHVRHCVEVWEST